MNISFTSDADFRKIDCLPLQSKQIIPMSNNQIQNHYVWGLDIVRFAAALIVVFFHLSWRQTDPQIFFNPGWVGVEIFFVISGFVIMGSANSAAPVAFIERRFARLYPAALVCAVISFAALRPFEQAALAQRLSVSASLGALAHSMLLLPGQALVSALWTLPIELAFYAAILLALIFGQIHRVTAFGGLLILWSGLYVIPFALTEYHVSPLHVGPLGYGVYNLSLLRHGSFFGVGMLIWQIMNRRPRRVDLAMLAGGIIVCWVEIVARSVELKSQYAYPVDVSGLMGGAVATFTLAVFAIWFFSRINDGVTLTQTAKRALRRIGLTTYPLYLMHEAVGGVAYGLLRQSGEGQGLALLAGLLLSLLVSLIVVEVMEPWVRGRMLAVIHPMLARLTEPGRKTT